MRRSIAIDVGGTFTDIVLEEDGTRRFYKSLSDHDDIAGGIVTGLEHVAKDLGIPLADLLGRCGTLSCGTTAATNAILEGRTARTVLICTAGFRDILRIREGGRENSYEIYENYPEPLVPRHLTFSLGERVNAEGQVDKPLDEEEARRLIASLAAYEPEAVAVALMWSIANPAHELRVGQLIEELLPGVPFSLSHKVNPTIGEYRRTSAAVIDASLKPIMRDSLTDLKSRLAVAGFRGEPLVVCSNGGRARTAAIAKKPAFLCLSGPSAAPAAALRLVEEAGLSERNIIAIDLGGTSLDVSIAVDGVVAMQRQGQIAGHVFGVPSVDVSTVASGGGSIARVDEGGLVHVGPLSAGSRPGPACYGRGGESATLTDANLVRGLLNPDHFGGGTLRLDVERARRAIEKGVAAPLGIGVAEAADIIAAVAEQNMVSAVEDITMRKGYDPRDFVLVSGGAAAGLHVANLARELGIAKVLIPRASSVLSAYGISIGDIRFDFATSFRTRSDAFDFQGVAATLRDLARDGEAFLDEMEVPERERELRFSVGASYPGQVWQIQVPVNDTVLAGRAEVDDLVARFHEMHQQLYSVSSPDEAVEFLEWSLEAVGRNVSDRPAGSTWNATGADEAAPAFRSVYSRSAGVGREMPVFDRTGLRPGQRIEGPAIVEDLLTACLLPENCSAHVTAEGGLLLTLR